MDNAKEAGHFPLIEKTLKETKRILRPKGVLVVTAGTPTLVKESVWFTKILPAATEKLLNFLPTNKQYLDMFAKCGFNCVSEMNLLTGATPSLFSNYYDPEGPMKEAWRNGTSAFGLASEQEIKKIKNIIYDLKAKGTLEKFMKENDRTSELGVAVLYICVSV